jgi:hypothetical protein
VTARRGLAAAALAALLALCGAQAKELAKSEDPARTSVAADASLQAALAAIAPQRPGHRDLFVLAVAGDGSETVFRNEVLHLRDLAAQRLDAAGHVLVLANHPPSTAAAALPEATPAQLRAALAGLGAKMDRDEDILLLYVTTHGTPEHELYLHRPGQRDHLLTARPLRAALDASGIRHRVVVLSACFAGGFAGSLQDDDTLLLMAARKDRPSFGCGNDSAATYFGRAWLVDGLNATVDFAAAFERAKADIRVREGAEELPSSFPQMAIGESIGATLADWRAGFVPGPPLPYPHADAKPAGADGAPRGSLKSATEKTRAGGTSSPR